MDYRMRTFLPNATAAASAATVRTELLLRQADGSAWHVSMSPGIERFIGFYPRIGGIAADGALLTYRKVAAAAF
jgi:hypothetical protein